MTSSTKADRKRLLVLLSSSFPFGGGETFLASEFPTLEAAFDEIVVISNDVSSNQSSPIGPTVSCQRIPYGLSLAEKVMALRGLAVPLVWAEVSSIRKRHPDQSTPRILATVLTSWFKAHKFARRIAEIRACRPGLEIYGYSYWANDMAVAVALSRRQGSIGHAVCRLHGWDVYTSRPEVGFLPFRNLLTESLDSMMFVSENGRDFFGSSVGRGRAAMEVVRLGTTRQAARPIGRSDLFTIVSCSSLIPLKRVDLLARAVRIAGPIRWVHIGDGPERSSVEALSTGLPPLVEVVMLGSLAHSQVIDTLRRLRPSALVNVSATEGLPVSMMEAMSLGIPVIGTRVGGVPEIVADGVNGFLLPADPVPEQIAAAIEAVRGLSEEAFTRLAQGAWRTWHDRFQAEVNFKQLLGRLVSPEASVERTGES